MKVTLDPVNIVVPVRPDDSMKAYHTPISRAVFESSYRLLAAVKAQLASKGIYYQMDSGPRIAAMLLRDEAKRDAEEAGEIDDEGTPRDLKAQSLFSEIKRLTTLLTPTQDGWQALPVDAALSQGVIDEEEWSETLSTLVFFTCHYALGRKTERARIATATATLLNASITSLDLSAYASSLPKWTPSESSLTPTAVSSLPS